ncbi:T9SS type A sorting domain-containing protein [Flavobacteriales bacterium]|nr:T9SS type A sorting domain-containing protein [Flavobacteriales bacterium]
MKRLLFSLILFSNFAVSQVIISNDTTVCGNFNDTLYALSATQSSMQVDDQHDVAVPIGFTFNFYGLPYTQCVVSGNGYITFDTSLASSYSPYSINVPIPNPGTVPENAILAPWHDINTGVSGNIYYGTTGIAPNRMFTVTWCQIAMFSCTDSIATSQVVMYEGSDKIDMYIESKPLCASWNGGNAVQGLVNLGSTLADIVTDPVLAVDRNFPNQWDAYDEGWEFIPNGLLNYTINQIPYIPIVAGQNIWSNANGDTLGYGPTLPVNISSTTTYYADVVGSCSSGILSDDVTINVSGCFDITLTSSDASCLGNDGEIMVNPGVGTPSPYDMLLLDMNGSVLQTNFGVNTTQTFYNLFPGTYVARVIDAGGSSSQDTVVVAQATNPLNVTSFSSDVSCFNGHNGQISVLADSGALPYSFYLDGVLNLNPIPYDSVFTNLSSGIYVVSVVDDNSCLYRDTVQIGVPLFPLLSLAQSKLVICANSSDGIAVGSGAGGTYPYSYEWFDNSFTSFSTNDTAFNLSAGSYYLEVTDANGCDTFSTVQVIAPQTSLSGSPQVYGVACKGDSTGMIVGDATGSWAPYKYYWIDNLGDTLRSTSYKTGRDTLSGLASGVYNLHVYDAQDCFVSYGISVGEPATSLSIDSISVVQTIACYGDSDGSARMFVSGGMPNYAYMWDSGETGLIAQNLSSGYRHVSLTDDWGCTVMDSVYISENPEIQATVGLVQTVSCYGDTDGIVTVSSIGGVGSHIFFWSTDPVGHTNNPDTVSGLAEGSYYVTTQDALGCEVLDSIYVSEPEPLTMQATALSWISCFGADDGLAYATGQGGNTPYTFTWSSNNQVGDTINTITPGTHVVTVVDNRGCTANDTVYMYEPDLLEIDIDTSLIIWPYCIGVNSASLTSIASGGTVGYTYLWDDNLVAPQLTATASHLLAGVYTVTVTDARGCTASDTEDIDSTTNTMSSSISILSNVSCFGGNDAAVEAITSGAHAPYSYQWFGPNGFYSTTSSISSLYAETYSVTVSDTNNCTVNTSINLTEPAALIFTSLSSTDATCLGACDGTIEISLTGGTAPYTGHAQNNNTGNSLMNLLSGDSLFSGVCAGDYTISLSDAHGCSSELLVGGNDQQTINALDTINVAVDPLSCFFIFCHGDSTGGVALDFSSYDTSYSYNWYEANDPITSLGNMTQIMNLGAGAYVVEANYLGCVATDTMVLAQPDPIQITGTFTHLLCYGDNDGAVDINVTGGSPSSNGYTYLWSNNITSQDLSNVGAGLYTLTVTDSLSCVATYDARLTEPDELEVTIVETSPFVLELSTVIGGTPSYTYAWYESGNNVGTGTSYVVSTNGTYSLEATDANNCTNTSNSITYNVASVINGEEVSFRVYPNPFREEATIDFGYTVNEATISIVDIYGKLIEQHEVVNASSFIITNKNKASGIYFMKMEAGNKLYNTKIIIK